jgi:hypothetical protein
VLDDTKALLVCDLCEWGGIGHPSAFLPLFTQNTPWPLRHFASFAVHAVRALPSCGQPLVSQKNAVPSPACPYSPHLVSMPSRIKGKRMKQNRRYFATCVSGRGLTPARGFPLSETLLGVNPVSNCFNAAPRWFIAAALLSTGLLSSRRATVDKVTAWHRLLP